MTTAVEQVAGLSNAFCRAIGFPKWITDNDRVVHHHTRTPQTAKEIWCTIAVHATSTFVFTTVVDLLVTRPLTRFLKKKLPVRYPAEKKKNNNKQEQEQQDDVASPVASLARQKEGEGFNSTTSSSSSSLFQNIKNIIAAIDGVDVESKKTSWYLLHSIFNSLIVYTQWSECLYTLRDPQRNCFPLIDDPSSSSSSERFNGSFPASLFGCIAIGAFHAHHSIAYYSLLTREDIMHHAISTGLVVAIGCFVPFGTLTATSNISLCGIPGAIIYFHLYLQKLEQISKLQYKNINRIFNIVVRYPLQLLCFYSCACAVAAGNIPKNGFLMAALMATAAVSHTENAYRYCDQTVGTYYVEKEKQDKEKLKLQQQQQQQQQEEDKKEKKE